jgi:hypothetical protein
MYTRSSSWWLLSLVILSALVVAELRFDVGKRRGGQTAGLSSTAEEAMPVPLFALADRETLTETVTRPLFTPNRQPPGAAPAASPVETSPAARPNASRYALSAIIIVDNERIALLTDTATGSLNRVREGETVAGWRVESIQEDSAVLRNGDTRAELSLRNFAAPAPRPRSPGRRTRAGGDASKRADGKVPENLSDQPRRPKRSPRQSLKSPGAQRN